MTEEQISNCKSQKYRILLTAVIVELVLIVCFGIILYIKLFARNEGSQDSLVVVTANEFRLVDHRDSTRAVLLMDEQLGPRLRFFDEAGTLRTALVLNDGEPTLAFLDSSATIRCMIGLDSNGDPRISGFNSDSSDAFCLTSSFGSSSLVLFDGLGNRRSSLFWSGLSLYDSQGTNRLSADVYFDNTPSFKVMSEDGIVCASVSIGENGPYFAAYDTDGVPRAAMTVGSFGASFSLYNALGTEQAALGAGSTTNNGRVQTYTEGSLRLFDTRGLSTIILPISY